MQCKHARASSKATSVGADRSSATAWADHLIIRRASPLSFAAPLNLCGATVTLLPDHSSGLWAVILTANSVLVSNSSILPKIGTESQTSYWGTLHSGGSPTLT